MKQIFLHIGLHKTGTTYIQKVFSDNRKFLKNLGLDYPDIGAEFLFGHHNFAWSFIPNRSLENTSDFSLEKIKSYLINSSAKKIVLSSEDLEFLLSDQIKKIYHFFQDFNVRIVMYIRNPVNAFYSRWQEEVKHGNSISILDYYAQNLGDHDALNYLKVTNAWANLFGCEALDIVVYDNLVERKLDILVYFIESVIGLNIDVDKLKTPKYRVNQSYGLIIVEILRQLNSINQQEQRRTSLAKDFLSFLNTHPEGETINTDLQTIADEEFDILDLTQFNDKFQCIESSFIQSYGDQIKNLKDKNNIFDNVQSKQIQVPSNKIIMKKLSMPIEDIYSLISA